jgi:UDP-N-acetylglucosamine 1-carboxyvinyltransferase
MALLCLADGNSVVTEKIFPERFLHVAELSRMGARLFRQGNTVVVSGVRSLTGAPVMASDLRASAGLVLAGLAAAGRRRSTASTTSTGATSTWRNASRRSGRGSSG